MSARLDDLGRVIDALDQAAGTLLRLGLDDQARRLAEIAIELLAVSQRGGQS